MNYIRSSSFRRLFSIGRCSSSGRTTYSDDFPITEEEMAEYPIKIDSRPTWKCFSFDEVYAATDGFSPENLVGKGGYAEVYKGKLSDGQMVAVKKLKKTSANEEKREREFLTEIGTIGHVCHPNVCSLVGCCIDNGLFLLFPYSPRGSVASILHDQNAAPMEWKVRYKIASGTAKGLHYLHKCCQRRIIHRDIKASNILLSEDFEPQISDFGLAKWLPTQWTHHSIAPIEGTVGYLAPEYFSHGIVDEKTDVYAFGVFLLEIISGKKPVDSSHQSLRSWAKPILKRGEIEKLVDPRLKGAYDAMEVEKLALAASLCVRASATWRPTMNEVLEIIMGGEVEKERWEMPTKEERDEEELWNFEDLESEYEYDDDDSNNDDGDDDDETSFSASFYDSVSTRSS